MHNVSYEVMPKMLFQEMPLCKDDGLSMYR